MANNEQAQQSAKNEEQRVDASKLTPEQTEEAKRGYAEYVKEKGHELYESWIPWIEDQYLGWFTKDNKASYVTKQQLDKTKVTNIEGINTAQDDLHNLVSHQLGKGGLFQPVGDVLSKEGINRSERGGKDEKGNELPSILGGKGDSTQSGGGYLDTASSYVSGAGSSVYSGAKSAAGYVGGMMGGKNDEENKTDAEGKTDGNQGEQSQPTQQTKSTTAQAERESKGVDSGAQQPSKSETSTSEQVTKPVTDAASKGAGAVQDGAKVGGSYLSSAGSAATGLLGGKKS